MTWKALIIVQFPASAKQDSVSTVLIQTMAKYSHGRKTLSGGCCALPSQLRFNLRVYVSANEILGKKDRQRKNMVMRDSDI